MTASAACSTSAISPSSSRRGAASCGRCEHVDIAVAKGETLAIVGESGSGKSVTSVSR